MSVLVFSWGSSKARFSLVSPPEDLVVAVGVEGRVYVNQIHAGIGQLGELFQIIAAINDAGVEEGGGFLPQRHRGTEVLRTATIALTPALSRRTGEGVFAGGARLRRALTGFGLKGLSPHHGGFLCHARSLVKRRAAVNSPGHESGDWPFSCSWLAS